MKYILIKKKEPVLLLQSKRETESSAEENKHACKSANKLVRNIHQPCLKSRHISKHSFVQEEVSNQGHPTTAFCFGEAKILPRTF